MKNKDYILENKIRMPEILENHIVREKLYGIMENSASGTIFLSGKPGYGKTAALAYFCRKKNAQVLWYRFDNSDNDIRNFVQGFTYALSKLCPEIDGNIDRACLKMDFTGLSNYLLSGIVNMKKSMGEREFYIVLDSVEAINNKRLLNLIKPWTECGHMADRLFMASRDRLFPCFLKALSYGSISEITEQDLGFSLSEIMQAGKKMGFNDISEREAGYVLNETGGWPLAAGLLIRELKKNNEGGKEIFKYTPGRLMSETSISSYISYEILDSYRPFEKRFIIKSSVLEFLEASLCDECLKENDSYKLIDLLCRKNLISAEGSTKGLKYPEPIRRFLLEQVGLEEKKAIEQRAVRYFQNKNDYINMFYYVKKYDRKMQRFFEQQGKRLLEEGSIKLVGRCIENLWHQKQELSVAELDIAAEYYYRKGNRELMEKCLNQADSNFGRENKYGAYRMLYRGLFDYGKNPDKYTQQINNALFLLKEYQCPLPFLLEKEQIILNPILKKIEDGFRKEKGKMIRVNTFGSFSAVFLSDGREMSWRTKKGCELFAYLLYKNGEAVERKTLLTELWEDGMPANAVAMLHNMFYNIRKELSYYNLDGLIRYKNKKYFMDAGIICSDLEEIKAAAYLVETEDINGLYDCRQLFQEYWGRFLEDMDSSWLFDKQEYFDKIFKKGCCLLAEHFMGEEKYETAAIYFKNALAIDDYSEEIMCKLLCCYREYNAWKDAKLMYDRFVIKLRKDLEIEPGEELKERYRECMEGKKTADSK